MSWRVSIDIPRAECGFPCDFCFEDYERLDDFAAEVMWKQPLRLYYRSALRLKLMLDILEDDYAMTSDDLACYPK